MKRFAASILLLAAPALAQAPIGRAPVAVSTNPEDQSCNPLTPPAVVEYVTASSITRYTCQTSSECPGYPASPSCWRTSAIAGPTEITNLTTSKKPFYMIDAAAYGVCAKDDTSDDTVCIQNAIDAAEIISGTADGEGGVVYIPPGVWRACGVVLKKGVRVECSPFTIIRGTDTCTSQPTGCPAGAIFCKPDAADLGAPASPYGQNPISYLVDGCMIDGGYDEGIADAADYCIYFGKGDSLGVKNIGCHDLDIDGSAAFVFDSTQNWAVSGMSHVKNVDLGLLAVSGSKNGSLGGDSYNEFTNMDHAGVVVAYSYGHCTGGADATDGDWCLDDTECTGTCNYDLPNFGDENGTDMRQIRIGKMLAERDRDATQGGSGLNYGYRIHDCIGCYLDSAGWGGTPGANSVAGVEIGSTSTGTLVTKFNGQGSSTWVTALVYNAGVQTTLLSPHVVSSQNNWFESDGGAPTVWFPTYGSATSDLCNLGFTDNASGTSGQAYCITAQANNVPIWSPVWAADKIAVGTDEVPGGTTMPAGVLAKIGDGTCENSGGKELCLSQDAATAGGVARSADTGDAGWFMGDQSGDAVAGIYLDNSTGRVHFSSGGTGSKWFYTATALTWGTGSDADWTFTVDRASTDAVFGWDDTADRFYFDKTTRVKGATPCVELYDTDQSVVGLEVCVNCSASNTCTTTFQSPDGTTVGTITVTP